MTARENHHDIRIGTLVPGNAKAPEYVRQILPHGFESVQLMFWRHIPEGVELDRLADRLREIIEPAGAAVSSLALFGNPLGDERTRADWDRCVDACPAFGCDLVCGFTGSIKDAPVPEILPRYRDVFAPIAERAGAKNVRIAFENCPMGGVFERNGEFNIAFCPRAWEAMFETLDPGNIGLEWEPCHQLCQLIDPLPQLRDWIGRVFHVHGKDATVDHDLLRTRGAFDGRYFAFHRTPGFGDTNWTDLISILRQHGFTGAIDIEGWHDPVYKDDLEMTGQVHALNHLKRCRGGDFVPNPRVEDPN